MRVLMFLLLSPLAMAQVFQLRAGNDTTMPASGGTLTCWRCLNESNTVTLGFGYAQGRFTGGIADTWIHDRLTLELGDLAHQFALPTDVFGGSLLLQIRGAGATWKGDKSSLNVIGGETAKSLQLPWLFQADSFSPVGAVVYERELTSRLRFQSTEIFSQRVTSIQGLKWRVTDSLTLSAAAGIGYNSPFAALSAEHVTKRIHARVSFEKSGRHYQLAEVPLVNFLSHPHNLNASLEVKPTRDFLLTAQHQDFIYALKNEMHTSTSDSVNGFYKLSVFDVNGAWYRGKGNGAEQMGESVGAGVRLRFLDARTTTYFATHQHRLTTVTFGEHLTRRVTLTQTLNQSQRLQWSFGGTFTSRRFTVSVANSMFFLATGNNSPWQSATSVTVSFKLPHFSQMTAAFSNVLGQKNFSTAGSTYFYRNMFPEAAHAVHHTAIASVLYRGMCQSETGERLYGCAIRIGTSTAYSNVNGEFLVRSKRPQRLALFVLVDEFIEGKWQAVSAPESVTPEQQFQIVVKRGN